MRLFSFTPILTFVFFTSLLSAQSSITFDLEFPEIFQTGKTDTIQITINKDGLATYAKYSQTIPKDAIVKTIYNDGASFSYNNGELTYTWLRTPAGQTVLEPCYTITFPKASAHISGLITTANFSYIFQNMHGYTAQERKFGLTKELSDTQIKKSEPKQQTENPDNSTNTDTNNDSENPDTNSCTRIISQQKDDGSYNVLLKIKTSNIVTARIIERIPEGFELIPKDVKNADTKPEPGFYSFYWQTTPSKTFEINYTLKPKNNATFTHYTGLMITVSNQKIVKYEIK